MGLGRKDLQLIDNVVDETITANNKKLLAKISQDTKKTVNTEIGQLRLEMNQRFDTADKKMKKPINLY